MIAEHLNLIAGVTDQFSQDLMNLANQLQYIDTLESKISPIRIDVNVKDNELQRLQRRMAQTKGASALTSNLPTSSVSSRGGGGGGDGIVAVDNMLVNKAVINELQLPSIDQPQLSSGEDQNHSTLNIGKATIGAATINSMTDHPFDGSNIAIGGGGGGSSASEAVGDGGGVGLHPSEMRQMEEIFDEDTIRRGMIDSNFGITDAASDGMGRRFINPSSQSISSQMPITTDQWHRAMDWDAFESNALRKITAGLNSGTIGESDFSADMDKLLQMKNPLNALRHLSTDKLDEIGVSEVKHLNMGKLNRIRFLDAITDMRIGMTQFYDILAAIMPLMFTFIGAIPVAVGALGALAAAAVGAAGGLAAIGALGWLGAAMAEADGDRPSMEDFMSALDDIGDDFFEAFGPLAKKLEPTFQDGLDGLSRFFDELADRGDTLLRLRDDAKSFGQFAIPFVADTIQMLALMGDEASDVFGMIGEGLEQRDILKGFAMSLRIALPYLVQLTSAIFDALPGLMKFSSGMLVWANAVVQGVTAVLWLTSTLAEFFPWIDDGNKAIGIAIGMFLTLTSVLLVATKVYALMTSQLVTLISTKLSLSSAGYAAAAAAYAQAAAERFLGLSASKAALAVTGLKWALVSLMAVTGVGLLVAGIGTVFSKTASQVDDATSSLKDFENQYDQMNGNSFDDFSGDGYDAVEGTHSGGRSDSPSEVYNITDNSSTTINAPSRRAGESMKKSDDYTDTDNDDFMHFS